MKQLKRIFSPALLALFVCTITQAQTADEAQTAVVWALHEQANDYTAEYTPSEASAFFKRSSMTVGASLSISGDTVTQDGHRQLLFKAGSKNQDKGEANAVTFSFEPKTGIAFTPTRVSLNLMRWVTDKASVDITWVNGDGTQKTLQTSLKPNRDNTDKQVSAMSYDLSGQKASEEACSLVVNIYKMNSGKEVSLSDITIEGVCNGTVGQVVTYTLRVNVTPEGAGTVSITPREEADATGSMRYESGDEVTLTQQAAEGYRFLGWQDAYGNTLGTASTYTFKMEGNLDVTARYASLEDLMVGDYIMIEAGDAEGLRAALRTLNADKGTDRRYIFLPDGTYDFGTDAVLDTIRRSNVSIIGQSMENTIIVNAPTQASVSHTAPIVNHATGTYLQDLTLRDNYNYGGDDGQAAAWQDDGHHTICKNVRLLSKQDTYYPHTDTGQLYWETSEIHGTVDFVCGNGDVFFNQCKLICDQRYSNEHSGDTHIAAPYTKVEAFEQPGGHGFIFMDCTVDCLSQTWDFGRGWRAYPKAAFLNTTLTEQAALRIGVDQTKGKEPDNTKRWTTKGIQSSEEPVKNFFEYNTMDEQGNVISPESNVLTFTANGSYTYETILKATETERFLLGNVYPDWTPDEDARQVKMSAVELNGTTLRWEADEAAKAFLILKDGKVVTIVDGTTNSYETTGDEGIFSVRAANMMGGFGIATEQGTGSISTIVLQPASAKEPIAERWLNVNGQELCPSNDARPAVMLKQTVYSDGSKQTIKVMRGR